MLHPDHGFPVRLAIKWEDSTGARALDDGSLHLLGASDGVGDLIRVHGLSFDSLLTLPEADLRLLTHRARRQSGRPQPDLSTMMYVTPSDPSLAGLESALADLRTLEEIEWAQLEAYRVPPPGDLPPTTPDYTSFQGYRYADAGIAADIVNALGYDGSGIRVADCEYGWEYEHEDLVDQAIEAEPGQTPPPQVEAYGWAEHGTAVMGEIGGTDNAYGVTGLSPRAILATYPEWTEEEGGRRPSAIAAAFLDSKPGDVVLLEMQTIVFGSDYGPAELDNSVWTVVKAGVDAGVIAVGAAGNGAQNLDSSAYLPYLTRGDSGSIIVGAGTADGRREPLYFSTYGARVDLQGWGEGVFTTGYGDYAAAPDSALQSYTQYFSGTSSASPIVASAAAIISQMIQDLNGEFSSPEEVREILVLTGKPQGPGVTIGPLPDLEAALDEVAARYAPALRRLDTGAGSIFEGRPVEAAAEVTWASEAGGTIRWRLDDDSTYEGASPELVFPDDGPQRIVLTLEDATGTTRESEVFVEVKNLPPVIELLDVPERPRRNRSTTYAVTATDPGVLDQLSYSWTFSDGTTLDGAVIEHRLAEKGPLTITVTVTDDDGGEVTETIEAQGVGACGCTQVGPAAGLVPVFLFPFLARRRRRGG